MLSLLCFVGVVSDVFVAAVVLLLQLLLLLLLVTAVAYSCLCCW